MFGIGDQELALILLFAFLLFGPDKLPGMGRTIGRALRQFRTAQSSVTKVVQSEIIDPIQNAADPTKAATAAAAKSEDDDLTEEEIAAAKPAETFAERRARLAAEKEAAAAAATGAVEPADASETTEPAVAADPDDDSDVDGTPVAPTAAPEPVQEEAKPVATAASLYGLDDDDDEEDDD